MIYIASTDIEIFICIICINISLFQKLREPLSSLIKYKTMVL
jgi:hypothetical protein